MTGSAKRPNATGFGRDDNGALQYRDTVSHRYAARGENKLMTRRFGRELLHDLSAAARQVSAGIAKPLLNLIADG